MELELKKDRFDAYEAGGELTLTQEETAETIVPDYCPDIARIIDTEGRVYLHSRELRDGKAEVSGTVRVTVLYTPDGESGVRTLEFAMPFSAESDAKAMPECVTLLAETEPEFLETRALNPRKVFTHCKLVTRLTGYRRTETEVCADVETEDAGLCIEKRQETQHTTALTHILEKDFTFSGELDLSPGRDGAAEILCSRVAGTVTETKTVGSKLILKGLFTVSLLYRSPEGACCSASGELPFSQVMEAEGDAEGASASVRLQLTGADIQVDGDQEGRKISVTLYLHAAALLRQERDVTLLCDLYSTAYDLTYDAKPLQLCGFAQTLSRRQNVRETLEIGVVVESILSLSAVPGAVSVSREGGSVTLRTVVAIRALYLDEGGAALAAERSVDVSCQLELPEDCRVCARAFCAEEPQGTLGDRGIEVRFPVEFRVEAASRKKRVCVATAKISSDTPKDLTGAPSLVLRCKGEQESLWDLAKRYNTTIPAILSANGLESEEEVPAEKLLLIPRKRA